jgi:hypothetical protein
MGLFRKAQTSCAKGCAKGCDRAALAVRTKLFSTTYVAEVYCVHCQKSHQRLNQSAFEGYRLHDVRPLSYYKIGQPVVYMAAGQPHLQGKLAKIVNICPADQVASDASAAAWAGHLWIQLEAAAEPIQVKSYDLRVYHGLTESGQQLLNGLIDYAERGARVQADRPVQPQPMPQPAIALRDSAPAAISQPAQRVYRPEPVVAAC